MKPSLLAFLGICVLFYVSTHAFHNLNVMLKGSSCALRMSDVLFLDHYTGRPGGSSLANDVYAFQGGLFGSGKLVVNSAEPIVDSVTGGAKVVVDNALLTRFANIPDVDYIIDNSARSVEDMNQIIAFAKSKNVKQIVRLSEDINIYNASKIMPMEETSIQNEMSIEYAVETILKESGIPFTIVRTKDTYGHRSETIPQAVDYFFDRFNRGLPVPMALHGDQLVAPTHVDDVLSCVVKAVGNDVAKNEVFHAVSNRFMTYNSFAEMIQTKMNSGAKGQYLYFDPMDFDVDTGGDIFPFCRQSVMWSNRKAKDLLDWRPTRSFHQDIDAELLRSKKRFAITSQGPQFRKYARDMEIIASKDPAFTLNYPFIRDFKNV
jgi:nucleoside-diphosphate-sugar epimerase